MNRLIDFSVDRFRLVLFLIALLSIPFGWFYANQSFRNHISDFFESDSPDIAYYTEFQEIYGNDEVMAIVFHVPNVFIPEMLSVVRRITQVVERHEGVEQVLSLSNAEVAVGDEDVIEFIPVIPDGPLTPESSQKAREVALSRKTLVGHLISVDGTTTCMMVGLAPASSNEVKAQIIKSIQKKAKESAGANIELRFSGGPCVEVEINGLTGRDNLLFTPITLLIIIFIVYRLLRNVVLSFLGIANILIIVMWGVGFLVMCGEPINTVTVIIAPVLLAIAIADSIHILSHYRSLYIKRGREHAFAVRESAKTLWIPCLFTSLTTGVGYLSFVTTTVRPVKIVGIFTAAGVMVAFAMSVVYLSALLMFFESSIVKRNDVARGLRKKSKPAFLPIFLSRLGQWVMDHSVGVVALFVLVAVVTGMGMGRLTFDTDFAGYLKNGNRVKDDLRFVERHIRGTVPVEMVLEAVDPGMDFTHPKALAVLDEVSQSMLAHMTGHYTNAFSAADYFGEIHAAFTKGDANADALPKAQIDLQDYYELADEEVLQRFISPDRRSARISLASVFGSNASAKKTREFAETHVKRIVGDAFTYRFTGLSALYVTMDENLKVSQVRSFGTAFVLIFIMMFFVCKNPMLTLLSMVPNLFPICTTLGIMGWLGIPLDTSTIMIASVTIGIAVDDTIHFITWFRRNCEAGLCRQKALVKTYSDTGQPIVMTSLVLCVAYFVLMTGSVKPIIAFGALAGLAMFFALLGDLLVLPALINLFKPSLCEEEEMQPEGDVSNV
ncbi:MAG: efflux RND transporter permease subunit [Desulfobacterales bacterium]|nr:efflux RND transporter permease subunit [Desulfobacterales bacterium]